MLTNPLLKLQLSVAFMFLISLPTFASSNGSLEGQLEGLSIDIRELLKNDQVLGTNRKLKLDTPSAEGMDDHLTPFFEKALKTRLNDILDETSSLRLKITYSYIESDTNENKGKRVIQLTAKIFEKGKPIKLPTREGTIPSDDLEKLTSRDINNTAEIGMLLGVTMSPIDSTDHNDRVNATAESFDNPNFKLKGKSEVFDAKSELLTVELRQRVGGAGQAVPVAVKDLGGKAFASVNIGNTYEIALYNYDEKFDVVGKVTIDGLNAISSFSTDMDSQGNKIVYPGYFVPRASGGKPGVHVIPGWMKTVKPGNDNVFEFVVNELGKGAATSLKVKGETGVVTVGFFVSGFPSDLPRGRNFGETGLGKPRKQDYNLVEANIESEPQSIVSIRYSRSPN